MLQAALLLLVQEQEEQEQEQEGGQEGRSLSSCSSARHQLQARALRSGSWAWGEQAWAVCALLRGSSSALEVAWEEEEEGEEAAPTPPGPPLCS